MSKKSPRHSLPGLEKAFFKNTNETIGNILSRLYGVQKFGEKIEKILQENLENETLNVEITKILQENANLSQMVAYQGHSEKVLGEISAEKLRKLIESNLEGGRALELLFTEALMQHKEIAFHCRPPQKMDGDYKIDILSRIPVDNP